MGKQAQLKRFKRWLRDRVARGVAHPEAAESYYRQAKGRQSLSALRAPEGRLRGHTDEARTYTPAQLEEVVAAVHGAAGPRRAGSTLRLNDEAALGLFRVGMSIQGPPEMFGLPPNDPDAPPSPSRPCVVTAVDYESGTITVSPDPETGALQTYGE
jgi:hypothetical protein